MGAGALVESSGQASAAARLLAARGGIVRCAEGWGRGIALAAHLPHHAAMIALDNGFQEAVALVADCDGSAQRLCAALGYRPVMAGPTPPEALAMLGIAAPGAREVLIAHPDAERGAIRLITVEGLPPQPLWRDGAQAWDSGGIFDINVRALEDIEALHGALGRGGFRAHAPITDWDFGALAVREVVESDADGLCIALMQRVHPPLTGYERIGGNASWVFNSTQVVDDFEAARSLFVDRLGWLPVQETEGFAGQASGANCMGLPPSLAGAIPMRIGIYHPQGRMEGSVEIIHYGCRGLDYSAKAPPARGWAALRFPVSDLAAFTARAAAAGCALSPEQAFDWAPHGPVRACAAITPWGARLEALQLL